uniref:Uncharacterized protein n=1 Tax=Avena sativa TaxID=4498 RepID=A0ACD5TVL5_AVESA
MAEIDTRPLESVQSALNLFEQRSGDHSRFSSPDRNEQEVDAIARELAACRVQLEAKESEARQASQRMEALTKAMQEMSDKYDGACLEAYGRIAELETDVVLITGRQSQAAAECEALREELAKARGEVDAVRRANSYVLGEVESMETRRILERECARDGLVRVLELNEAVLESAVAAMRAEEERSVFFQEATLELLNSGRDREAVTRQMESMEGELLAKTVEVDCLRSELKMLKELYVSSEMAGKEQELEPDVAQKQTCLATEISREIDQVDGKMTEDVAGEKAGEEVGGKACQGDSEVGDTYFDSELPGDLNVQYDDEDEDEIHGSTNDSVPEHDVEGHEEPELGDRFVDESFKSMHSEYCKDICAAIGMPENLAGKGNKGSKSEGVTGIVVVSSKDGMPASSKQIKKEVRFLDESFKSINSDDCKGMNGVHGNLAGKRRPEPEAAGAGFVVVNSKDADGDGKFYSNATGDADKLGNGYVLVAKTEADGEALKDLDVVHAEISDLRFSLEVAVRRAELAEEAKAALERELKEEIKMKQRPARSPAPSQTRPQPPVPSQDRKVVVKRPAPGCVTLGKMLNMKYK